MTRADKLPSSAPVTLSIDIGGSGLKAMLLAPDGKALSDRQRVPTPTVPTPDAVIDALDLLQGLTPGFDRVSVGFPGVIRQGRTLSAFNLHPLWENYPLAQALSDRWQKPVRIANDADMAGYAVVEGNGVELVLTLGTGMGAALFTNGHLCPGLELGHHIWRKRTMTYEDYIGRRGLDKFGKERWNERLQEAIESTRALFNWDTLYIGGGNTKKITFPIPPDIRIVSSEMGLIGGAFLWRD